MCKIECLMDNLMTLVCAKIISYSCLAILSKFGKEITVLCLFLGKRLQFEDKVILCFMKTLVGIALIIYI